jgi:Lrp/AsnC family transcriptional regulator
MDELEQNLLALLQSNADISMAQLAEQLHCSESSVRRRISALQERGILERKVWLVKRDRWPGVTAIINVSFAKETTVGYREFKTRMQANEHVSQCYSVAGSQDFVLLVHAENLEAMETWHERELMSDPSIRRSESQVVWSVVNFDTRLRAYESRRD